MNETLLAEFGRMHAALQDKCGFSITYTPRDADPVSLTAVKADRVLAFPDTSTNALEAIWIRNSDLEVTPVKGESVAIGDRTFFVLAVRADRAGGSYLALG